MMDSEEIPDDILQEAERVVESFKVTVSGDPQVTVFHTSDWRLSIAASLLRERRSHEMKTPPPQSHMAPDAAARLERILRLGRSMKWTVDGAPALDDENTAVALGELFQIFFQDAVDRALATTEGN